MGLKINQNINFQTFLVFPEFELQHQHFGVTTSAFWLCYWLCHDKFFLYCEFFFFFFCFVATFFCYVATLTILSCDISILSRDISIQTQFLALSRHFFFFVLSQHKIALLRHCFCSAPVFLLQLVRTITSSFYLGFGCVTYNWKDI